LENIVAIDSSVLTAQQRLAMSRRALVEQLNGGAPIEHFDSHAQPAMRPRYRLRAESGLNGATWIPVARKIARRWWQNHPANAVGHLALPALERYARQEPVKVIAAAAAAGALVVLVRPWRLVSITAVLAALLKTSDVAGIVTTLIQRDSSPRKDPK